MYDVYLPSNEVLKKHIRFIYAYKNVTHQEQFSVVPFVGVALTVFENAKFSEISERVFCVEPHEHTTVVLHAMRADSVEVIIKGEVNAFMLMLTPLGINHFIRQPLGNFLHFHSRSVIPFHNYAEGYPELAAKLQSTEAVHHKLEHIEQFLLNNYHHFENDLLREAVHFLSDTDNTDSIHKICRQIGVSERTLNRLFQKYLCISPIQLRNICRFRSSIDLRLQKDLSFCELALESNYTDHAYLVRVYKKFTGRSPKEIFKQLESRVRDNYLFSLIQQRLSEKYNHNDKV